VIPEGYTQRSYMHEFGERFRSRGKASGRWPGSMGWGVRPFEYSIPPGCRCGVTDAKQSDNPIALLQSTRRASGNPTATPEFAPPHLARIVSCIVKTRPCPQ